MAAMNAAGARWLGAGAAGVADMDERKAFEAWAVANEMTAAGDREDRLDYPLGRCLWRAWQAATAAERERAAKVCERERMVRGGEVFAAEIRRG